MEFVPFLGALWGQVVLHVLTLQTGKGSESSSDLETCNLGCVQMSPSCWGDSLCSHRIISSVWVSCKPTSVILGILSVSQTDIYGSITRNPRLCIEEWLCCTICKESKGTDLSYSICQCLRHICSNVNYQCAFN